MAWNGSDCGPADLGKPKQDVKRQKSRTTEALLVLLLSVVAILAFYFYSSSGNAGKTPDPQQGAIPSDRKLAKADSSPAVGPRPDLSHAVSENRANAETATKSQKVSEPEVIYAIDPKEKAKIKDNRVYKTSVEEQLQVIFMTEPGDAPPVGLPELSEGDLQKLPVILAHKAKPDDGDSDDVKEIKGVVEFAKAEFAKFIKNGGDARDFLPYYQQMLESANERRKEAHRQIMKFLREEGDNDPDLVREYIRRVDAELEKDGIKRTTRSPKVKALLGEE